MDEKMTLWQKIGLVLAIIVAIIAMMLAGQTDQDEYIEVNSTPVSRMPFYYE